MSLVKHVGREIGPKRSPSFGASAAGIPTPFLYRISQLPERTLCLECQRLHRKFGQTVHRALLLAGKLLTCKNQEQQWQQPERHRKEQSSK